MAKFIIYSQETGKVWRDLDQYTTEPDGTIFGGINGVNTLRYPLAINPAIVEITDEEYASIENDLHKCIVSDGVVMVDPNYTFPVTEEYTAGYDQAVLDLLGGEQ